MPKSGPERAAALGYRAQVLESLGKVDEVETDYRRAVQIVEAAWGAKRANFGAALHNPTRTGKERRGGGTVAAAQSCRAARGALRPAPTLTIWR
jgi:hypothetical protein